MSACQISRFYNMLTTDENGESLFIEYNNRDVQELSGRTVTYSDLEDDCLTSGASGASGTCNWQRNYFFFNQ